MGGISLTSSSAVQASESRKVCLPCFEYYDGWYSYIIQEGGRTVSGSELYGDVSERKDVRAANPVRKAPESAEKTPAFSL